MNFEELKSISIPEGKVKQIEVNGVLVWALETKTGLVYLGKAPNLTSNAVVNMGSGWNSEFVIFSGGSTDGNSANSVGYVTAYDSNLVKRSLTNLNTNVQRQWGGNVGNYACVGGGENTQGEKGQRLNGYDLNGVHTTASVSGSSSRGVVFYHKNKLCVVPKNYTYTSGSGYNMDAYFMHIYSYDSSLTKSTLLSAPYDNILNIEQKNGDVVTDYAINSTGDYIVLFGGMLYTYANFESTKIQNAYCLNEDEVLLSTLPIPAAKWPDKYKGVGFDNGALFFRNSSEQIAYFIDNNLVMSELTTSVSYLYGDYIIGSGNTGIFIGDNYVNGIYKEYIPMCIDKNGIVTNGDSYTNNESREDKVVIGVLGNKVFIAGGSKADPTNIVDVYELSAK